MRNRTLLAFPFLVLLASGCLLPPARPIDCTPVDLSATTSTTPGPGGWCQVPDGKTATAPPAVESTSASSTPTGTIRTRPPSDQCSAASPCPIPAPDARSNVTFVLAASYSWNTSATLHVRNNGATNYTFSWPQESCDLAIYDNATGHRIWLGVCSDYSENDRIAPGGDADLFIWNLKECTTAGPWYGGCDGWTPVARGTYQLRQSFCESARRSVCIVAGASLRIV